MMGRPFRLAAAITRAGALVLTLTLAPGAQAAPIPVVNASFEDLTGTPPSGEFTLVTPNGWVAYEQNNVLSDDPGNDFFVGTLEPGFPGTVTPFFDEPAPDGDRVALLFNFAGSGGQGEYGIQQTLDATLQANTTYTLSVWVGNIASGVDSNGTPYDLDGFPGYRVELFTEDDLVNPLAFDDSSLSIEEGHFELSTVSVDILDSHASLGQRLVIRLVNENPDLGPSDIEVDFDLVTLTATPVDEPAAAALAALLLPLALWRRRSGAQAA